MPKDTGPAHLKSHTAMMNVFSRPSATLALLLSAVVLVTAGCKDTPKPTTKAPVPVKTIAAVPSDEPLWLEALGRAEGRSEINVVSRVAGNLTRIGYAEGTSVKAGATLFVVDEAPYKAALAAAEATVKQRQTEYAQAEREMKRTEQLAAAGSSSRKALDDAKSSLTVSASQVKAAQAALTTARLNLAYTRITAPTAGTAGRALVNVGGWVTAGSTVLTTLSQPDDLRVTFTISESDAAGRRITTANPVRLFDTAGNELTGELDYVAREIDPKTATLTLRARLTEKSQVLPGQYVHVQLARETLENVFRVPQGAVQQKPDGTYQLFIEKDGKVSARTVKLGTWKSSDWIVLSGLSEGEAVVVSNLQRIKDGTAVKATPVVLPPAPEVNPYAAADHTADAKL